MSENYLLVDSEGNATEVSGDVKIGRNKTNELVILDPLASRHHATVYMEGESLMIRDEGSSNGTFVNGEQIFEPTALADQDVIKFGDEEYIVRAPLWDTATIRAPKEGEEPAVEEMSAVEEKPAEPKKSVEISAGPPEPSAETLVSDLPLDEFDTPPKKNNRTILIIGIAVILLCFCCLVIAGIILLVNRSGGVLIESGSLRNAHLLTSLVLTL